jgi:hypothetical protein
MSRKKTKEQVNQQLEDQGRYVRLKGDYHSALTKTVFVCEQGHEWLVRPNDVLNGHGCPECAGLNRSTQEKVNTQLATNGRTIRMVGEYISALTKSTFRCAEEHEWEATPNAILRGRGCPTCYDNTLTAVIVNERLINQGRTIKLIGDYVNNYEHTTFTCGEGHTWLAATGLVLNGSGCPSCAQYGYSQSKPGYMYVIRYDDYIKYGITNNLESRLSSHRKWGEFTIVHSSRVEDGRVPYRLERMIKKTLGGNFVSRDIMENGFTETLSLERLPELMKMIDEFSVVIG